MVKHDPARVLLAQLTVVPVAQLPPWSDQQFLDLATGVFVGDTV